MTNTFYMFIKGWFRFRVKSQDFCTELENLPKIEVVKLLKCDTFGIQSFVKFGFEMGQKLEKQHRTPFWKWLVWVCKSPLFFTSSCPKPVPQDADHVWCSKIWKSSSNFLNLGLANRSHFGGRPASVPVVQSGPPMDATWPSLAAAGYRPALPGQPAARRVPRHRACPQALVRSLWALPEARDARDARSARPRRTAPVGHRLSALQHPCQSRAARLLLPTASPSLARPPRLVPSLLRPPSPRATAPPSRFWRRARQPVVTRHLLPSHAISCTRSLPLLLCLSSTRRGELLELARAYPTRPATISAATTKLTRRRPKPRLHAPHHHLWELPHPPLMLLGPQAHWKGGRNHPRGELPFAPPPPHRRRPSSCFLRPR
jgi:hypothetical protein